MNGSCPIAFDLIVQDGTVVLPWLAAKMDIGIHNGKIMEIGDLSDVPAKERYNAEHLHVLPGVIDSQVHFREPGMEYKEDLESGTAAACLGGVTSVLEMPNTNPPTTTIEQLAYKIKRSQGRVWTDIAFFAGGCADNISNVSSLEEVTGSAGIKIFMGSSTGSLLAASDDILHEILAHSRRRVAIHAEDELRLVQRKESLSLSDGGVAMHPIWRDPESALIATQRILRIASRTRKRIHVLHVSTAAEMAVLAQHRATATVEVTPQHLTLSAPGCYELLGARAQMNPPIRELQHQEALWKAIDMGLVDTIGSDHAPHSLLEKALPYPKSPSGLPGVQTMLPIMLTHVNNGRLSLLRMVDLLSSGPARVYSIAKKGRITIGMDADLTIVDLKRKVILRDEMMATKVKWTPFAGMEVRGWPVATILRGNIAMREGELRGNPRGNILDFDGWTKAIHGKT
ncbi:MAG: dihydroorotase [Deltaproteobacteria bacterium]|nr:dihydroorotase [Deltaproteobacteria bacterium]